LSQLRFAVDYWFDQAWDLLRRSFTTSRYDHYDIKAVRKTMIDAASDCRSNSSIAA
jgi:hypothetical protein